LFSDLGLDRARAMLLPTQGRVLYTRMKVRASPSWAPSRSISSRAVPSAPSAPG
jgi:hypothetical protein